MKVKGDPPDPGVPGNDRADVRRPDSAIGAGGCDPPEAAEPLEDLPPDPDLLREALQKADQAPAMRQELIERMRQALARDELGADAERLADRMIDSILKG